MARYNLDETKNDRLRKQELKAHATTVDIANADVNASEAVKTRTRLAIGKKDYRPTTPKATPTITNSMFTKDGNFLNACADANVEPTTRQASKFRNKKGKAYKVSKHLLS